MRKPMYQSLPLPRPRPDPAWPRFVDVRPSDVPLGYSVWQWLGSREAGMVTRPRRRPN